MTIGGRKTNKRKFPDGSGPRPDKSKFKRAEAKERKEAYDKLSVKEKLDRLDRMFGEGKGASSERKRLEGR